MITQFHHHHHVPEGLGMFPVPWSSRWSWSLHLFLGRRMFFRPFFSTQASLPNFNAALAVMLWILNFVSLFICFPKCLRITPFILLYVCNLSSKSLLYSDKRYPRYLKSVTCSIILSFIIIQFKTLILLIYIVRYHRRITNTVYSRI